MSDCLNERLLSHVTVERTKFYFKGGGTKKLKETSDRTLENRGNGDDMHQALSVAVQVK